MRILYDGDNYAATWSKEAARRGLLRLDSAVDASTVLLMIK